MNLYAWIGKAGDYNLYMSCYAINKQVAFKILNDKLPSLLNTINKVPHTVAPIKEDYIIEVGYYAGIIFDNTGKILSGINSLTQLEMEIRRERENEE